MIKPDVIARTSGPATPHFLRTARPRDGVNALPSDGRERRRTNGIHGVAYLRAAAFGVSAIALAACQASAMPEKPAIRVGTATVEVMSFAPPVVLTGEIKPRLQSDLSFRVAGRIIARAVEVGGHVTAGDVLARIDPQEQEANVASA